MGEWRDLLLGELVDQGLAEIRTGPFGTQLHASDYVDEGIPVINVRNLGYGTIRTATVERIDAEVATRLAQHRLVSGDIVFGRKGAVDRHVLVRSPQTGWVQGSDCIRLRILDGAPVCPEFLSNALLTPSHKNWIQAQGSHGATMASLNQGIVARIPVSIPEPGVQRRVAAALSAFDDLIKINERRIELLEDLARSFYREWFVRFRFPGHEDVGLFHSVKGAVPDGWRLMSAGEVFHVTGGGTPSKKHPEYWDDGTVPWYTPSDLTRSRSRYLDASERRITPLGLAKSSARLFSAGSVLMTSRATLGVLGIATEDGACNQGFIVIPPTAGIPPSFVREWLAANEEQLAGVATGATFKEITRRAFKQFPVVLPPSHLLDEFTRHVGPVETEVERLERQSRALAATRDLLLPRLVTGHLDIDDIDLGDLLPAEAA